MKLQANQTKTSTIFKLTIPAFHIKRKNWKKGTELNVVDSRIISSDIEQIETVFEIFQKQLESNEYLNQLKIDYEINNLKNWLEDSLIITEKGDYLPDDLTGKKRPRPEKPGINGGHPQDKILLKKFLPLFISLAKEEITKIPADFELDAEDQARITELMAGGN